MPAAHAASGRLAVAGALALSLCVSSGALGGDAAYEAGIRRWRSEREASLVADGGWLSVAGLFWLKEGDNRFGSGPDNEIVLPASAPAHAGVFVQHGVETTVRVEPGVDVRSDGKPVASMVLRSDAAGEPDVLSLGRLTLHVVMRGGRYAIRLKDNDSPRRREFVGLRWFPVREAYRVTARFVPYDPPRTLPIPNILGQVEDMPSPGAVVFSLGGKELRLDAVFDEPDAKDLFFIFRDPTSAKETYPAGRFLHADLPKDGRVVLDFNKAYSPPCAFTPFATCPLPPKQNRLPVPIEAGELNPHPAGAAKAP